MNRRKFLQWLGLAVPVAAVAPKLLLAVPEAEAVQTITSPWINHPIQDIPFPKSVSAPGIYKYVKAAHPEDIHTGDFLMYTDKNQHHVVPIRFKPRQPPLHGHAIAIAAMKSGQYGWVLVTP